MGDVKVSYKDTTPRDAPKGMQALASANFKVEDALVEAIAEHVPEETAAGGLSAVERCSLAWKC